MFWNLAIQKIHSCACFMLFKHIFKMHMCLMHLLRAYSTQSFGGTPINPASQTGWQIMLAAVSFISLTRCGANTNAKLSFYFTYYFQELIANIYHFMAFPYFLELSYNDKNLFNTPTDPHFFLRSIYKKHKFFSVPSRTRNTEKREFSGIITKTNVVILRILTLINSQRCFCRHQTIRKRKEEK